MKESNIKSQSDFIRISSGFFIAFTEAMKNVANSEVGSALEQFNKDLRTELDKVPPEKAKLRGKWKAFDRQMWPKLKAELKKELNTYSHLPKKEHLEDQKNQKENVAIEKVWVMRKNCNTIFSYIL